MPDYKIHPTIFLLYILNEKILYSVCAKVIHIKFCPTVNQKKYYSTVLYELSKIEQADKNLLSKTLGMFEL
jgi:hypothetical protein